MFDNSDDHVKSIYNTNCAIKIYANQVSLALASLFTIQIVLLKSSSNATGGHLDVNLQYKLCY